MGLSRLYAEIPSGSDEKRCLQTKQMELGGEASGQLGQEQCHFRHAAGPAMSALVYMENKLHSMKAAFYPSTWLPAAAKLTPQGYAGYASPAGLPTLDIARLTTFPPDVRHSNGRQDSARPSVFDVPCFVYYCP